MRHVNSSIITVSSLIVSLGPRKGASVSFRYFYDYSTHKTQTKYKKWIEYWQSSLISGSVGRTWCYVLELKEIGAFIRTHYTRQDAVHHRVPGKHVALKILFATGICSITWRFGEAACLRIFAWV